MTDDAKAVLVILIILVNSTPDPHTRDLKQIRQSAQLTRIARPTSTPTPTP